MSNVRQLPDTEAIERQASEWIARLEADDVSGADRERFEAWRTEHPAHARAFQDLSETWKTFVAAGPLVRAVSFAQSMNEAAGVRATRRRWIYAATAAAILLVMLGEIRHRSLEPQKAASTFSTAVGEHARISLPDGSTLELNSDSFARVNYSGRGRVIRLERGEGFFEVAHDTNRPFWVLAGGSWVRAVGTAFNVSLTRTAVEVTVSEGTVRVGSTQGSGVPQDNVPGEDAIAVLKAGEQVELNRGLTSMRRLSAQQLQHSLTWREGTVYFEARPLADVVAELGRYTTLELIVDDESLAKVPVGGTFRTSPEGAEALLNMLEQGFGLRVRYEGNRALIERAHRQATPTP
jgi:transmembrane sensor